MVVINGENVNAEGMSISEYLESAGYDKRLVAVERNGEIIVKADYGSVTLCNGDCVEVVRFVGGG